MDSPQSSKAIEFLAFQITQNKHNGPNCHATFLFFPTKDPLHPKKVSLTERGKTHETPKKEKNTIHPERGFPCLKKKFLLLVRTNIILQNEDKWMLDKKRL